MARRTTNDSHEFHTVQTAAWRCLVLWLSFAAGISVGCGPPEVPQSDIHQSRQLLIETLDAWVAGETLDAQRAKDPPVYVAEDLWFGKTSLNRYELNGDGEQAGTNVRFRVTLHCGGGNSRSKPRKVYYLVTTVPAQTIAREDR